MHILVHYNQEMKGMKNEIPLGWCLSSDCILLNTVKNIKCTNPGERRV